MRYVRDMAEPPTQSPLPAPTLVLAAHPNWRESRANRALLETARAFSSVHVRDLYSLYPDYDIDVAAEQAMAEKARLIVLLHPVQWYAMPALQKLWIDEVLSYGWAYGHSGTALQGKDLWLVATTGGTEDSYHPENYNRYFFDAFLPPYEQTAFLCGMRFLPPMILHGARRASDAEIAAHAKVFGDRLRDYPDWPELEELAGMPACEVPPIDRPSHG